MLIVPERGFRLHQPEGTGPIIPCRDADCAQWDNGWTTTVDETVPDGRIVAERIRTTLRMMTWAEHQDPQGRTVFTFAAHQPCGRTHRARQQTFWLREANNTPERVEPARWVDTLHDTTERISDALKKG